MPSWGERGRGIGSAIEHLGLGLKMRATNHCQRGVGLIRFEQSFEWPYPFSAWGRALNHQRIEITPSGMNRIGFNPFGSEKQI